MRAAWLRSLGGWLRLRRLGGGLLLLVASLTAVQPLLAGVLPWSADGLLHFYRLAQLHRSLQHGILFPRWSPDMGFGFGFPLFNYYAPLSYYLAEPFHLAGLSVQHALLAAFILATLTASIGAYLCGRDLFGPLAGLVAALAFVYAPYNLYNVVHRGALAEAWGLAWLPFIFWAWRRLALRGRRADLVLSVLLYAALLLTHNILALISTPLLILYAIVLWGLHGRGLGRALLLTGALALGLGLAAFFWVPAFFEKEYVQIHQLYAPADLDYHNNFVSLGQLFSAPQPVDPALINPLIPLSFAWPQLALALVALLGLRRFPGRETRVHLALLGLGLSLLTLMMLPLSIVVWDNVPLLRFVQFPWRFLGPTSLFLAVLAGAGAASLPLSSRSGAASLPLSSRSGAASLPLSSRSGAAKLRGTDWLKLPLILVGIVVFAFTWLFPHFYPRQADPTPLNLIAFERDTGALGTTSAGDYLPIWVERLPPADSLLSAYEETGPGFVIPRLDAASLPAGACIVEAHYGLTIAELTLDAPTSFTAVFNWYFFPGWQARLDGQPLELRPLGEQGLIGADVPSGRHHLIVRFGATPLRRWATALSLLAVLSLAAYSLLPTPQSLLPTPYPLLPTSYSLPPTPYPLLPAALVALALFALKAAYLDHNDSVFRRSRFDGQTVADVQTESQINFDDQLMLIGYDLTREGETGEGVRADGLLELALYWRALRPLDSDYSIAVHLVDDQGRLYGQKDSQHPAGYPTSRWQVDTYGRDLHRLAVWPGAPPGQYTIQVGVYDAATGRSLDIRNAAGVPIGTAHSLASVRVTRPARAPNPDNLGMARRLQVELGGGLRLLGFDPPPAEVNAGDQLPLTLYWQATTAPAGDYTARLSLVASNGAALSEERAVPGRADYPTSEWPAGDVVRDGRLFLVPAGAPEGEHILRLDLVDGANEPLGPPVGLLSVAVHTPERSYDPPAAQHPISATLGGQATLLGYALSHQELAPGQPLTLTLYWRAEATAETSYVAFAHLLDGAEHIRAQSDRVPAAGARPTTGWLPGEIIRDTFTLTVAPDAPPGRHVLEVGMYDPVSGERLCLPDGSARILLSSPIQVQ